MLQALHLLVVGEEGAIVTMRRDCAMTAWSYGYYGHCGRLPPPPPVLGRAADHGQLGSLARSTGSVAYTSALFVHGKLFLILAQGDRHILRTDDNRIGFGMTRLWDGN